MIECQFWVDRSVCSRKDQVLDQQEQTVEHILTIYDKKTAGQMFFTKVIEPR